VTDDAQLLRRMSAVRSPYTRSEWYDGTSFNHKLDHVFSERNEARHNDLRVKMASGVCPRSLEVNVENNVLKLESGYVVLGKRKLPPRGEC
jgi:hypothetical protein